MKNGSYNITLNGIILADMESPEEALVAIARMILEMHENEDDLLSLEPTLELIEEHEAEYETEEDDGVEELDFEKVG